MCKCAICNSDLAGPKCRTRVTVLLYFKGAVSSINTNTVYSHTYNSAVVALPVALVHDCVDQLHPLTAVI
jgi:hypothetical protein